MRIYQKSANRQSGDAIEARVAMFEEEWQSLSNGLERDKEKNKGYVLPKELQNKLTKPLQCILEWYARADTLSLYYQQRTSKTLKRLFCLVFAAIIAFEFYSHIWTEQTGLLLVYPFLIVLTYALYFIATKNDWEGKYLDYRALAEGLRVQFFWRLSGIEESAAEHYMHIHKTEMEWIRLAINKYCGITGGHAVPGHSLELVLKHWVEDQAGFFSKRSVYNQKKQELYDRLIMVFFLISPVISLLLAGYWFFPHSSHAVIHGLMVGIAVTLLISALLSGYSEKKAFKSLARRYNWMSALFNKDIEALREFLRKKEYEYARDLIRKLGRETLLENGSWLLLHRERPLEVPKG